MKYLLWMILISSISLDGISQKKWNFGAEVFSNYTIMSYTNNQTLDPEIEKFYKENEFGKFCTSLQLFVTYNVNLNSSISVGIGYHNTGQRTKEITYIHGNIDPRKGFVAVDPNDPSIPNKSKIHYKHYNIQVPILYSYSFSKLIYVKGGINTLFNFSNTAIHYFTDQNGNKNKSRLNDNNATHYRTNFRKINIAGQLGIGINLYKSKVFTCYAQPTIERSFLGLSSNAPLNRTPFSWGLVLGAKI